MNYSLLEQKIFSELAKSKYKAGDILTTQLGKHFTIVSVNLEQYRSSEVPPELVYKLKGHFQDRLPASYLDKCHHVYLATETGKLLYGNV